MTNFSLTLLPLFVCLFIQFVLFLESHFACTNIIWPFTLNVRVCVWFYLPLNCSCVVDLFTLFVFVFFFLALAHTLDLCLIWPKSYARIVNIVRLLHRFWLSLLVILRQISADIVTNIIEKVVHFVIFMWRDISVQRCRRRWQRRRQRWWRRTRQHRISCRQQYNVDGNKWWYYYFHEFTIK